MFNRLVLLVLMLSVATINGMATGQEDQTCNYPEHKLLKQLNRKRESDVARALIDSSVAQSKTFDPIVRSYVLALAANGYSLVDRERSVCLLRESLESSTLGQNYEEIQVELQGRVLQRLAVFDVEDFPDLLLKANPRARK